MEASHANSSNHAVGCGNGNYRSNCPQPVAPASEVFGFIVQQPRDFRNGWASLVSLSGGALSIETTANQDSPITVGHTLILGIDVWEHAYYLKHKNKRPDYVKAYFSVINRNAASATYADKDKA